MNINEAVAEVNKRSMNISTHATFRRSGQCQFKTRSYKEKKKRSLLIHKSEKNTVVLVLMG